MSTAGQPHLEPAWKQEVNRRIAAHKNRKSGTHAEDGQNTPAHAANSRAAQAAARVAARYAKAPSYSEMQAQEARLAVRAAEIATKVALEAQAAAESALAELHAAAAESPSRGPAVVESITREPLLSFPEPEVRVAGPAVEAVPEPPIVEPAIAADERASVISLEALPEPAPAVTAAPVVTHEVIDGRTFDIRWEPDLPLRAIELKPAPARPQENFELLPEDWWTPAEVSETLRSEPLQVEAQSTHANLIEFPRELVATRKLRPRLIEPAVTAAADPQLSIFEVDPGAISTEPAPAATESTATADNWVGPEWSSIKLDAQPEAAVRVQAAPAAARPDLAPLSRRLLATVVDGSLIAGVFFAVAMWGASHMQHVPAAKAAEAMAIAGLVLAGLAYHAVFFGMGTTTPGMKYAGIAFSTFDDELPTRQQLHRRFGAMVLSLFPVGLGFAWSLFDDDHLTWHDRISGTYPRKR
ncbi:MAG: RDD family protein [Acidobacteriota bacterium]